MNRRRRRLRCARGQVVVMVAAFLGLVLVPLGLAVLAANMQRTDHAALSALVQRAALDGAGALADTSLGTPTPTLAGGSASCGANLDAASAAGQACHALQTGLYALFGGTHPRVSAADALADTDVAVLNGTPNAPVADPATGRTYHYPTVCVSATIRIGLLEDDGPGFTYHFHACAQSAYR